MECPWVRTDLWTVPAPALTIGSNVFDLPFAKRHTEAMRIKSLSLQRSICRSGCIRILLPAGCALHWINTDLSLTKTVPDNGTRKELASTLLAALHV